ncbi:MAG: LysM peptidoglycan-binding domain-containing protein [Clostridiales bacterium]|nr:LysM peptidoglycan-binding domain-containing protein [Clostridiales bacterium]
MKYMVYKIEKEEDIEAVSERFGVPSPLIIRDNRMRDRAVFVGMRLLIRKNPGEIYYAEPFDTLEGIAKKFGAPIEEIKRLNDGIEEVFFGQVVYVPASGIKD